MPKDNRSVEQVYRDGLSWSKDRAPLCVNARKMLSAFDRLLTLDAQSRYLPMKLRTELEGVRAGLADYVISETANTLGADEQVNDGGVVGE